jgi:hypothetical protein
LAQYFWSAKAARLTVATVVQWLRRRGQRLQRVMARLSWDQVVGMAVLKAEAFEVGGDCNGGIDGTGVILFGGATSGGMRVQRAARDVD